MELGFRIMHTLPEAYMHIRDSESQAKTNDKFASFKTHGSEAGSSVNYCTLL